MASDVAVHHAYDERGYNINTVNSTHVTFTHKRKINGVCPVLTFCAERNPKVHSVGIKYIIIFVSSYMLFLFRVNVIEH